LRTSDDFQMFGLHALKEGMKDNDRFEGIIHDEAPFGLRIPLPSRLAQERLLMVGASVLIAHGSF